MKAFELELLVDLRDAIENLSSMGDYSIQSLRIEAEDYDGETYAARAHYLDDEEEYVFGSGLADDLKSGDPL